MTGSRVVYTALFGGYEKLLEQPVASMSEVEFICFTDNPALTSSTWQVRVVEPALPEDLVRSARILKIRGHESIEGFDEVLWIDNSVLLRTDPALLLEQWLGSSDLAIPAHSFRSTIAAEFDAVLTAGRDDPLRLDEQLATYTAHHPDLLEREVLWTALLARRFTPETRRTMQVWLDHVLRYSRRDQLSIVHALAASGQHVEVIELENEESEWHRWPVADRRELPPEVQPRWPIESDPQRMARLHAQIDEITVQFNRAVLGREAELQAMLQSRSWRFTSGLRSAADRVRPLVHRMRAR